jgi:hypothetical protein
MEVNDRTGASRRYLGLLVAIVAVSVAASLWGRPTMSHRRSGASPDAASGPAVEALLRIEHDGTMTPDMVVVEKGTRVAVSLRNESARPVRVELPGYQDRIAPGQIEPGATWRGEFVADRPGDDFAWLLHGKTAGRLVVNGSHLIEGHR